ncbi:FG-GAP-like repeat-containing protein, partial [Flavobacteriaceae bacterium 14752]|uniref:FG-GAP-like repeat-containing protein n=1 Tax=Mesohalobacter salilacus TaxID=2491711 RepID=UPI000F644083
MKINLYLYALVLYFLTAYNLNAQDDEECNTGLDIHIANDISGSVDATEFQQSKDFITQLGLSFAGSLGTDDTETRISISNWSSGPGNFLEFNFPVAGPNYTTEISDIVAFGESPRPFSGGTDIYTALLNAFNWVNQNPIPNRSVPKVIVLLTDAFCDQIPANLTDLANQIKSQGIVIILLAVDDAADCTSIQGTNVASPNGYFSASNYTALQNNAVTFVQDITQVGCDGDPPDLSNAFDLTIELFNYELINCNPGPPEGSVEYTITNNDLLNPFNDILKISFYDGDPTIPGTQFLFTEDLNVQNIPSNGGTFNSLVTSQTFLSATQLYAVVNFDGSTPGNEVPLLFSNLPDQVEIDSEEQVANNISDPIDRIDDGNCAEFANIDVQVTNSGVGCDAQVFYTVEVCNIGTGNAVMDVNDINHLPPSGFNLQSFNMIGANPFISDLAIGPEQIVSINENDELGDVIAADLDGDGDLDVISANLNNEKVAWYANDGVGNFGPQQAISSNMGTARLIYAADLDADGDQDVIAAGDFPNEISWFENDGSGNFTNQQIISSSLEIPEDIFTADLENDGDLDILAAFGDDNTVAWYQNDGAGNFGPQQAITINAIGASSVFAGDFDGDGDLDVVSTSATDDKLAWYENDGVGNFGPEQFIAISASTDEEVKASDLNGDGAIDIIATGANQVTWFENDGTGNFGPEIFISNVANSAQSIFIVDFDSDGDLDVLSSSGTFTAQSKISWFENDGAGNFGPEQFITGTINEPQTVFSGDFDGDDDPDVLSISTSEDKIVWYENLIVTKLPAQTCATYEYVYDINGLPAGDYDYTVAVEADAEAGINPFVIFNPNSDFSFGTETGLNGFDGTANTSDDLTFSGTSSDCVPGEQIVLDVSMTGDGSCPDDFSTATITINNQSGLTLNNTVLTLDLSGVGAIFNGEPYNLTNGLVLAEPNIFDPNYPNVPNAISQQNGPQSLDIFSLPGGVSTFNVDFAIGTALIDLSIEVSQIPTNINDTGIASGSDSITPAALPTITGNCPTDLTISESTIDLNFTVSNATSINWTSGTQGDFTNPSSGTTTYIISDQDLANGFVNLSLQAFSAGGCLEILDCQVNITGGLFDYGDAPISYDLNENSIPVAAGALINSDVFFGSILPGDEPTNQPTPDASGDGNEEDAISLFLFTNPSPGGVFEIDIEVTNNSLEPVFAHGFLDWNVDGDFIADTDEKSELITIPANTGTDTYQLIFNVPNNFDTSIENKFLRLRLSSDELAAGLPFGTAANGEVEDYLIIINEEGCTSLENDIVDPTPLDVCQASSGGDLSSQTATFDLTTKVNEITQGDTSLEVMFFESQQDIDNNNPIDPINNYVNSSNPQTLEVRVFDPSTGCEAFTSLSLVINVLPALPPDFGILEECDEDADGVENFNLTLSVSNFLTNNPNFNAVYFTTQPDANGGVNPIPDPTAYQNT